MCGRYSLMPDESEEIARIVRAVESRVRTGEMYPTSQVPVLMEAAELVPEAMAWGFPGFHGKSVRIINARSETALERRCVVPTTGFYEWGPGGIGERRKYRFNFPGDRALYLAGFWNDFSGERKCVILTTAANRSLAGVHDRMPVVLRREELEAWVRDIGEAADILRRVPPELNWEIASQQ